MTVKEDQKELAQNLRTEYTAVEAYHRSLVHYRFITVAAYFAGASFIAGPALEARLGVAIWACLFALLLTICAWMLELRTRTLYRKVALRGEQIEHEYWGYRGDNWYAALWSRQYKSPPPKGEQNVPDHPGRDGASVTLIGELPRCLSKHVSHSAALDLLYFGSGVAWIALCLSRIIGSVITST